MIYQVYAIYDRAAGMYAEPHLDTNNATAVRWFRNIMSQTKFQTSDFDLMHIGTYDCTKGQVDSVTPSLVVNGGSLDG